MSGPGGGNGGNDCLVGKLQHVPVGWETEEGVESLTDNN